MANNQPSGLRKDTWRNASLY